ncbi:MAG TPA: 50S ribosomal protein L35 [Syntrophorhabdaceae bacterium]|jgi:large subunit ribosomal protein L35|nr:50S ribosomal protein L35 [Syntrophorhabdaceae bacterium]MDI9560565.1 50S ribosomal protein L35 [Pseudomonadota bacterium]OQC50999.1 MAG: 50S ribosomal protein L35 [Deltaproteobacteria bacterium ADurb.Bin026]MBP8698195.1 50S ribosomal protein L35 [Syntrophorhabdaceae bacterium]MBV6506792.1 50S ribosomal protein L35 [Syntrophorhabdaceae bacterium]
MPKIKTKRGLAKRVKVTATGKIKRAKAYHSHLLSSKTPKMKRRLSKSDLVHKSDMKRMKSLIPYL